MRATEIFTPTKLPVVTYIDDHLQDKAKALAQALEMGAAVISISGPSKSGKTVFIEKTLGRENLIQVTGAGVDSPQKLWDRVFDIIGTPTKVTTTEAKSFTATFGAKGAGKVPLIASAEASAAGAWGNSDTTQAAATIDYLQLLIRELGGTDFVVFIDDFHYIAKESQQQISHQIKEAVRGGVKFICASVPYHSDDVIRANPDLRGRIVNLDFNYWKPEELAKIAQRGFEALAIKMNDACIQAFAAEAAGSPQLMQSLCLYSCFESGLVETRPSLEAYQATGEFIKKVCERTVATSDFSSTVAKMKDGPKTRGTERKSYLLNDGQTVIDVYPLVLRAIALDPPELTFRYASLLDRIGHLCAKDSPVGSSVIGACAHMSSIANDAENRVLIEWDAANDVLDMRDPYLLFFLRWGTY